MTMSEVTGNAKRSRAKQESLWKRGSLDLAMGEAMGNANTPEQRHAILARIEKVWNDHPDFSFGQLVYNSDSWYLRYRMDGAFIQDLEEWSARYLKEEPEEDLSDSFDSIIDYTIYSLNGAVLFIYQVVPPSRTFPSMPRESIREIQNKNMLYIEKPTWRPKSGMRIYGNHSTVIIESDEGNRTYSRTENGLKEEWSKAG